MTMIKRILKWFGYLVGVLLLLGLVQIGWGLYREPIALKAAH